MVQKLNLPVQNNITADVIILGCSLPGIVTAHKLKKKFGDSMDIMVLDLSGPSEHVSKCNVAFQATVDGNYDESDNEDDIEAKDDAVAMLRLDTVAKHFLAMYAQDFSIPIPDCIVAPERLKSTFNKLFQHRNGSAVVCETNYHDFEYLNILERFELNQYQALIDRSMRDLFETKSDPQTERSTLLYYDQTTMEKHITDTLLFPTSREIMRNTVHLVCGVPAKTVSLLFYLHQCYRTSSSKNHLDGNNTRFREKLLGYCRKHLANKLQKSVADITLVSKPITEIRTFSDEQVILETIKGETNYVCNLVAMALRPDELHNIRVEPTLLSEQEAKITTCITPGRAKKFVIQYEENFWRKDGYSGDILSIHGPIIWAMERPKMSSTGSTERYSALIGYLMIRENEVCDSKEAVLQQLEKLFGKKAAKPVNYRETDIADVFVPRCGDFVALRRLTMDCSPKYLEWGTLDVFADGDVAAALEAGHNAYLHLLTSLRPQAQTFEDCRLADHPMCVDNSPLEKIKVQINLVRGLRVVAFTSAILIGLHVIRSIIRK